MGVFELIVAKTRVNLQLSAAYVIDLWFGLVSTFAYGLTYILLLTFVFDRVPAIGGYTKSEVFLLLIVGQLAFFLLSFWSHAGNVRMIEYVNNGNLDYVLLRPVSPLWNLATEKVNLPNFAVQIFITLPAYAFFVDWSQLEFRPLNVLIGLAIMFIGIFIEHVLHFLICATAFWYGEARNIEYLIYGLSTHYIPYESMPSWFRGLFTIVIPTYVVSSVAVSAMLGKSNPLTLLLITVCVGVVFYIAKIIVWKQALRVYTSASS